MIRMTDLLDMLVECGAVKFGDFTLTSGKKSSYYVDIKLASTRPEILREIASRMSKMVEGDMIAGMELGAVPLAVAVALETNKPYVILRKGERTHGTGKRIEGVLPEGARVTVVEDVVTSGGSSVKSISILREAGARVDQLIVVVDRGEGGREAIEPMGVRFRPLVDASALLSRKS